jgi:hypothetical protein
MTTPLTELDDWVALEPAHDAIPLDPDHLDLSHLPPEVRWAYRLQQLAVQGFERWLQEREPSLVATPLDRTPDTAATLQVGGFRVCLIPTSLADDEVAIPQAVVEQAEHAAHFYVAIALDEEAEVANLVGFLPYDQLAARCTDLTPDADQTYPLPTVELNPETHALLLFLQCLSPSAIALPTAARAPQLDPSELIEAIRQPLANAGTWLQRQMDTLLLPGGWQPIPATALRRDVSPVTEQWMAALEHFPSLTLPPGAGTAYQVVSLAHCTLQLFATVWPLPDAAGDWMLLVLLCPAPGQTFPPGISLVIDEITPGRPRVELARETLAAANQTTTLFAQVKGNHQDVFDIVITAGVERPWAAAIEFGLEA